MKRLLVIFFIGFASFNLGAQEQQAAAAIKELMGKLDVAGLAVAVVKNNKIVYQHSFGYKDLTTRTPLQNTDIFRIASISKSFAATSIMQLVEAKKFSLDDDFSNLVGFKIRNPNFPDDVITLRMILSHTSSINDSQGYFNLDVINPAKNKDWKKCYTTKKPGTAYLYCNLNFNMVGAVIERFSGQRFDSYVKAHILTPLNLYGGYCIDSLDASKFVSLYEYGNDKKYQHSPSAYAPRREELSKYVLAYSTPLLSPTGGMKISASDLATYMTMHMNYGKLGDVRIISKKSAKQMQTPLSSEENYGLALRKSDQLINGKLLVGHTGSAYGLYSAMFFEPKEKFGIVVITNGTQPKEENGFKSVIRQSFEILYQNFIVEKK